MKIEAKLFEILTVFFILVRDRLRCLHRDVADRNRVGRPHSIILSAGLSLIVGTYFRFVARRLDTAPRTTKRPKSPTARATLGFFSPGSFWPIRWPVRAAFAAISLAFLQPWMIVVAVVLVLTAAAGLVFEYHLGPEKHYAHLRTTPRRRTPAGFGAFAVLGARHRVAAASGTQFPWKPLNPAGADRGGSGSTPDPRASAHRGS